LPGIGKEGTQMNNSSNDLQSLSAIMVIFGGTGDLTHRKLMPALYNLILDQLLPENFAIVAVGRRDKTEEEYIKDVYASVIKHSRSKLDEKVWDKLQTMIHYYQFDFTDMEGFSGLKKYLDQLDQVADTNGNRVFYLAVAPEYLKPLFRDFN
jgi:glucose-6-phosphate 1-dehydrogenase